MSAHFIVSIDTELKWGYRRHSETRMARLLNSHEDRVGSIIDNLLSLFERYEIPATWAIVGKLFYEHQEIVEKIIGASIRHEIGYHSFSHVRFSEASRATARNELEKGLKIQDEFGVSFRSFVFPENSIGHVDLLWRYGFLIYRGVTIAPKNGYKNLLIRAKNFALSKVVAPTVEPLLKDGIWEIPGSMEFYDLPCFQTLVFRAKEGIKKAIKTDSSLHVWLHPEDALQDPKMLDRFEKVLESVHTEAGRGKIRAITMGDLALALQNDMNGLIS